MLSLPNAPFEVKNGLGWGQVEASCLHGHFCIWVPLPWTIIPQVCWLLCCQEGHAFIPRDLQEQADGGACTLAAQRKDMGSGWWVGTWWMWRLVGGGGSRARRMGNTKPAFEVQTVFVSDLWWTIWIGDEHLSSFCLWNRRGLVAIN